MDLVNATAVPAALFLVNTENPTLRAGVVVAKATYLFNAAGEVRLDTEDPFPILTEDQKIPLGLLPRDDLPRREGPFEVILLGSAHAPAGRATGCLTVALQVGGVRRELLVSGDRTWSGEKGQEIISEAIPFLRMPLSWERAYGGFGEAPIEGGAKVELRHALNPEGRGFDPGPQAAALAALLEAPEPPRPSRAPQKSGNGGGKEKGTGEAFPLAPPKSPYSGEAVRSGVRVLPNIEDPAEPIRSWDDEPSPACWATPELASALHLARMVDLSAMEQAKSAEEVMGSMMEWSLGKEAFFRAVPDWTIPLPEAGARVVLEHLTPEGELSFDLPRLRVFFDYLVGERSGQRELEPQMLLLLPDQKRFCITFRHRFCFDWEPGQERSLRLRLEQGWFEPEKKESR